jgi:hypothetical protein
LLLLVSVKAGLGLQEGMMGDLLLLTLGLWALAIRPWLLDMAGQMMEVVWVAFHTLAHRRRRSSR